MYVHVCECFCVIVSIWVCVPLDANYRCVWFLSSHCAPPLASPPLPDLPADDKRWAAGLDFITSECQRWHESVEERRRVSMQSSVTEAVGAAVAAANAASDSRWAAEVSVCASPLAVCWLAVVVACIARFGSS